MLTRRAMFPLLTLVAFQAACSPLATFDAVAGRDEGGGASAKGLAFGPHPRHRLDIYAPAGTASGARLPVVMFIYGGSWRMGAREEYGFVGSALASRGLVTVIADYRLVPEVRFPDFLDDGALALAWVRDNIANHGGDPGRIGLAGHSAGAYNAVMLALDTQHLRKAGVDPRLIKAVVGISGPYDFFPWSSADAEAAFATWPNPKATQPINFARRNAPPMLLVSGADDRTVKPTNTTAMAARLTAQGASASTRLYPGLGHIDILTGMSRLLRQRGTALDDMDAFFKARL
ncbi:MAG: alpha/beta hydrolase [Bosea sp. (in: a-proteobacteria)]